MFNDTLVKIYSSPDSATYIKSIFADFQPYIKSIVFEDSFQIDITNRLFCDTDSSINKDSYFEIESEKYKVMDLKKWNDYFEVYLYKLKRQV